VGIGLPQSLWRDPLGFVEFQIGHSEVLASFLMVVVDSQALEGVSRPHEIRSFDHLGQRGIRKGPRLPLAFFL
jgi:hypothetical protein